jgi:uncharacterized protein
MGGAGECLLKVRVQPRAAANEVVGWRDGILCLRLTAPPVEGAANDACREFLAEALGVRRADVDMVAGAKSREKRFQLPGLTLEEARSRLGGAER